MSPCIADGSLSFVVGSSVSVVSNARLAPSSSSPSSLPTAGVIPAPLAFAKNPVLRGRRPPPPRPRRRRPAIVGASSAPRIDNFGASIIGTQRYVVPPHPRASVEHPSMSSV